jgi:alpha-D-ribose 1-methylphosphonate 5-phosphate C-P lyase
MAGVDDLITTDISYTIMKSEEPPPAAVAVITPLPVSKPAPISTPAPIPEKPVTNTQILAQPVPIPQVVKDVLLFVPGEKNWNYCKSFDAISRLTLTVKLLKYFARMKMIIFF